MQADRSDIDWKKRRIKIKTNWWGKYSVHRHTSRRQIKPKGGKVVRNRRTIPISIKEIQKKTKKKKTEWLSRLLMKEKKYVKLCKSGIRQLKVKQKVRREKKQSH